MKWAGYGFGKCSLGIGSSGKAATHYARNGVYTGESLALRAEELIDRHSLPDWNRAFDEKPPRSRSSAALARSSPLDIRCCRIAFTHSGWLDFSLGTPGLLSADHSRNAGRLPLQGQFGIIPCSIPTLDNFSYDK